MMESPGKQGGVLDGFLIPMTRRLLKIPYLQAIRESFYIMMPVIILLTLVDSIGGLLFDPLGAVLGDEGLGLGSFLSGGLHDQAYRDSAFFHTMEQLKTYMGIATPAISLLLSLVLTDKLALLWQGDRLLSQVCTMASYLFLMAAFKGDVTALSVYFMGRGFFLALLISTFCVLIFSRLAKIPALHLAAPQEMPADMRRAMKLFLPLSLTLIASLTAAYIWIAVEHSLLSLPALLQESIDTAAAQSPVMAVGYELVRRLLWWLGLNGYSLTFFWNEAFYVPAQLANEVNDGRFIFTVEFFDANSISLLGLAISVWVFSYREKLRSLSAYSLPCLLLSINEPFLFALPIVLNPLFLVPYLLAPVLNVCIGALAIGCGIVPLFRYTVEVSAPVFLQGMLATGDIMGAVLQLVWLSVDIVVYTPFVIIFNMLTREEDLPEGGSSHEA